MKKMKIELKPSIFFSVAIVIVALSLCGLLIHLKKDNLVQGHPTNSIKIDEGGEYEYVVPKNAGAVFEPEIKDVQAYKNHVQNITTKLTLKQEKFSTYYDGNMAWNTTNQTVLPLPNGNFVATFLDSFQKGSRQALYYYNSEGEMLDTYYSPKSVVATWRFEGVLNKVETLALGQYQFKVTGKMRDATQTTQPKIYTFQIDNNKIKLISDVTMESTKYPSLNVNPSGVTLSDGKIFYGGALGITPENTANDPWFYATGFMSQSNSEISNITTIGEGINFKNPAWGNNHISTFGITEIEASENGEDFLFSVVANSSDYSVIKGTSYGLYIHENKNKFPFKSEVKIFHDALTPVFLKEINESNLKYIFNTSAKDNSVFSMIDMTKSGSQAYKELKKFPPKTSLYITTNEDNAEAYSFFGYIGTTDDEFKKFSIENNSIVYGTMSKNAPYDILTASGQKLEGDATININKAITLAKQSGTTGYSNYVLSGLTTEAFTRYPTFDNDATSLKHFIGVMSTQKDYSPVIEQLHPLTINSDGPKETLDERLLQGNNNSKIGVYDVADSRSSQFPSDFLQKRINRNPNKISNDIDWEALGYNKNKSGPQLVTYFVTDSQLQSTSTSRIVNNLTDQTKEKGKSFLDAHGFHISLSDIKTGVSVSNQDFRKKAKVVAWETGGLTFVEDAANGLFDDSKVVFPESHQLSAIRNATEAKPYPLDITYKGSSNVTSRVWVFVTNENTTVKNNVVLYADDFKLPLKDVAARTSESVLKTPKFKQTQPGVLVYDYQSTEHDPDKQTLTPISKGKKDGTSKGLTVEAASLTDLKGASTATTLPNFQFEYKNPIDNKSTTVKVKVTLEDTPEFCFKLERTKEKLIIVESIVDSTVNSNYKSIEVKVPLYVTLDSTVTHPTGWQAFPVVVEAASRTYQYNMQTKNDKQSIEEYLAAIKLTIATASVDAPGAVTITLREDELLANTKPKIKSAKSKTLRSSQVITTNDFRLEVANKWDDTDEVNYVDLEWEAIANLSTSGYQLMQSENNGVSWNTRSLNYGKPIKVLNVYPNRSDSETLKGWMDELGLTSGGSNLIQVTPVKIDDFNANADGYLKNGVGEYIYDVLMFGSWDAYSSAELKADAYTKLRAYTDSGRGVLFGHDTLMHGSNIPNVVQYNKVWFNKYGPDVGTNAETTPTYSGSTTKGWASNTKVQVVNNGYLMKYPFELKNDVILTIPRTHTINHFDVTSNATLWLEFDRTTPSLSDPYWTDGKWTNNWYLITNNNVGMIQTGHSGGTSTIDERKIIANTLYNLAQVSLDNHGQDYTVKDEVPPEVKTVTRDFNNRVTIDGKDDGKKYQYYVTADTKDKGTLKSDVVEEVVTSDIRGYIYVIDAIATTVPSVIKDSFGRVTNINAPVINPDMSREATISGFTSNDQWLHIIPVDRANNVGAVKHIQMKEIEYVDPPEAINCSGNIPQKVYLTAKDDQGRALSSGNHVLETELRIGKEVTVPTKAVAKYQYVNLVASDGTTVIHPEKFTITDQRQIGIPVHTRTQTSLHIRQVILDSHGKVVVPKTGHGQLEGIDTFSDSLHTLGISYPTHPDVTNTFKEIKYSIKMLEPFYQLIPTIPEYYQYDGYSLTTSHQIHDSSTKQTGPIKWDLTNAYDTWVTVYLKPSLTTTETPGFYGWSYGKSGEYEVTP